MAESPKTIKPKPAGRGSAGACQMPCGTVVRCKSALASIAKAAKPAMPSVKRMALGAPPSASA